MNTKHIAFSIVALLLLNSCLNKKTTSEKEPHPNERVQAIDSAKKSVPQKDTPTEYSDYQNTTNEIPPSGSYRFDIAFAEWQGKSMGEKVTVKIDGHSIQVIYEGDGNLSLTEKGEIMKHKSGKWIIGNKESDKNLDEVGGCIGGPAIIDFLNKKYWMC